MADSDRFNRLEQASLDAAASGLKALLLLNGGSCVAILGFLAAILNSPEANDAQQALLSGMIKSLVAFSFGSGLAVLTSFFSYIANQAYASSLLDPLQTPWSRGTKFNSLGLISATISLISFFFGVAMVVFGAFF